MSFRLLSTSSSPSKCSQPAAVSTKFEINKNHFIALPDEDINGGMMYELNTRAVSLDDKMYEERAALVECNVHVEGIPTGEEVIMDGTTYTKYEDDIDAKWVQEKGPSSLIECEDRSFLRLIIRQEKY
jgi:hypothetical protein